MPQPRRGHGLPDAALALANGPADGIQRRNQTRRQGRRIIAQVEVFDTANNETGIAQQFQHRILRVIDDVARNIEAIPFRAERFELPAIDVRHLKDDDSIRLQYSRNLGENAARICDVLHHVKQRHDVE